MSAEVCRDTSCQMLGSFHGTVSAGVANLTACLLGTDCDKASRINSQSDFWLKISTNEQPSLASERFAPFSQEGSPFLAGALEGATAAPHTINEAVGKLSYTQIALYFL
ncbi:hypothetical protein CDAR_176301 [Caerostris darwini]|uniref:Uncharacterized protein n=1 Tax=Caerostris darwini TaxID=1538125 RepID=A0AAV4P123_9ARAC|nr:hypothetical protein CDAR_176301 [Caerostris darwini]